MKTFVYRVSVSLFLVIQIFIPVRAQDIYFTNISNALNLPSQECYNVLQDSKGYIWICTDNGLVKYSKYDKIIFDKRNGLEEQSVYYIAEMENGAIELLTSANRYLLVRNDSIIEHDFSDSIKEKLKSTSNKFTFNLAYLITRKRNGDVILNTQQRTFLVPASKKSIIDLTEKNDYNSSAYIVVDKNNTVDYFIKNNFTIKETTSNGQKSRELELEVFAKKIRKKITLQLPENTLLDWRVRIQNSNGITFIVVHDKLIKIDESINVEIIPFPSVITAMYCNPQHGLWIGTTSFGVYHFQDIADLTKYNRALNGLTVSSIIVDHEGGTWCATTEKGIYYSKNYHVLHYPEIKELNKKPAFLKTIDDKIFTSTEIDKLIRISANEISQTKLLTTGNADVTDIIRFKNKYYLSTKAYLGVLNKNFEIEKALISPFKSNRNIAVYQFDSSSTNLYALGIGLVLKVKGDSLIPVGSPLNSKAKSFKVINDTLIYVGCVDGLYKMNTSNNSLRKIDGITTAVTKIILASSENLLITTKGEGLFELNNDHAKHIPLDGNAVNLNDIIEQGPAHFWISSNEGLISYESDKKKNYSKLFNTSNGIVSNNIGSITISNNCLFASTPDGIFTFPTEANLINNIPPRIEFQKLQVNDVVINDVAQPVVLKYDQNNIAVSIDQLTYREGGKEGIVYRLDGNNKSEYKFVKRELLSFDNLPPDDYELTIYAVNNDGIKSTKPVVIKFTIQPPFWKTFWFIALALIVSLCVIILIVIKIIFNIKKKESEKAKLERLISDFQLKALQAQMNPHFIFNAINSIQNYVLNKKEDEAYDYLAKFSKLVRMVLNNSRETELSLQTEIETLNLYIELEQLRFDNSFDYTLKVSEEINLDEIEIPTMILQPYVENAIWHGLMHLKDERKGELKIDIKSTGKLLLISIEDNGIGRARSSEFKKESIHHSVGMQLIDERLELIKRLWETANVKIIISDLHDDNGEACGTRVELFLPLN